MGTWLWIPLERYWVFTSLMQFLVHFNEGRALFYSPLYSLHTVGTKHIFMSCSNAFITWEYHSGYGVENIDEKEHQEGAREAAEGAISGLKKRAWWWAEYRLRGRRPRMAPGFWHEWLGRWQPHSLRLGKGPATSEEEGHILPPEVVSIYITAGYEFCLQWEQEIMKIHSNEHKLQIWNKK